MWGWGNGYWTYGAWLPMMLAMVVFLAFIVWAVVVLTRSWASKAEDHDRTPNPSDPIRILEERFARGEIDEEEYAKRRTILQQNR